MGVFFTSAIAVIFSGMVIWELSRRKKQEQGHSDRVQADSVSPAPDVPDAPELDESSAPQATSVSVSDVTEQDDFRQLKGIGPVYAKRLYEADIHTFTQLAALTSEQVARIVAPGRSENLVNAHEWIAQAREMSS